MIVRGGVRKLADHVFICEKVLRLQYLVHRFISPSGIIVILRAAQSFYQCRISVKCLIFDMLKSCANLTPKNGNLRA
jgi:hypothetical protein